MQELQFSRSEEGSLLKVIGVKIAKKNAIGVKWQSGSVKDFMFCFCVWVNFGTLLTDLLKAFDCISHKLTYLQNYMRMVLAWEYSDWYIVTLVKENKEQE